MRGCRLLTLALAGLLSVPAMAATPWPGSTKAPAQGPVAQKDQTKALLQFQKDLASVLALRTEAEPLLVINKVGVPRRPEIAAKEFASSIECRLLGQIPFDAAIFGTAANNGQMIAEVAANNRINEVFRQIGMHVTGRSTPEVASKSSSKLSGLFSKRKRA